MEYSIGDFFIEEEDSDTPGFVIIDEAGETYLVAEKWLRPDSKGGDTWLRYEIEASRLAERVSDGKCRKSRSVSDKKLKGFKKLSRQRVSP